MRRSNVAVVGAGIVGMSAALYLQQDGHHVTVFDPEEPGSGASYGNSGSIATALSLPVVTTSVLRRVPQMLRDPDGPIVIRPGYLPHIAPWLIQLALATRPAKIARTANTLGKLLDQAEAAFEPLVTVARAQELIRATGRLMLYSTDAGYESAAAARAEWTRRGINFQKISVDEAIALEPALARVFKHAVYLPGTSTVIDPKELVTQFARVFVVKGGTIKRERVRALELFGGVRHVVADSARLAAEFVIIAAGAWSKALCKSVGVKVPLDTERGYHVMLKPINPPITRSVMWADRYIHLVPMAGGIRLGSGVEFAGLDAPPDYTRIRRLAKRATELLPSLEPTPQSEWLGFRPSLPDSLPMIGRLPGNEDVIACFGHHHLGLTLGPISGRLVADMVAGRQSQIDIKPFRVRRSFVR